MEIRTTPPPQPGPSSAAAGRGNGAVSAAASAPDPYAAFKERLEDIVSSGPVMPMPFLKAAHATSLLIASRPERDGAAAAAAAAAAAVGTDAAIPGLDAAAMAAILEVRKPADATIWLCICFALWRAMNATCDDYNF